MSTRGGIAIYTSSSTKMSNSVKVDGDQMFLEEKKFGEATLDLPVDRPKHKPRRFVRSIEILLRRAERPVIDSCSRDLLDVADYIDRHGWCQYQERNDKRQVCTWGAFRDVIQSADRHDMAQARFERFIGTKVVVFNDCHGRTVGEVTAALRACASGR
jgi:hypothetical protein